MEQKSRGLGRKLLRFIIFLLILLGAVLFWAAEFYQNNPLADVPDSFSISQGRFSCDEVDVEIFKMKADSILNNGIALKDFMGVSTGVSKQDCGNWFATAGFSNKKRATRPDKNTVFRLASISKPFTAVAIMQLLEKGKIDLDDVVQDYLPEFPISKKGDITIRQLLKHTSGIVHYKSTLAAVSFKQYDNCKHALDKFKDEELAFEPGSGYLYSTYGYTVLGAIIEEVSGLSYQDYMDQNIWQPANMKNTSIEDHDTSYENKASLYLNFQKSFYKSPNTDLSVKYPGGGIQSTAEDMLRFGNAIINNDLIDSTSLAEMMKIDTTVKKQGDPYGLGYFVVSNEKHGRVIQHGGSQSGSSTFFRIYLDKKVTTVSLANSFGSNEGTYLLSQELANLALDSSANTHRVNYFEPMSKTQMRSFEGTFVNKKNDEVFEFSLERGQLYAQLHPYPKLPIFPSGDKSFFYRHFDGQVVFNTIQDDWVEGLKYYYKGEVSDFERI